MYKLICSLLHLILGNVYPAYTLYKLLKYNVASNNKEIYIYYLKFFIVLSCFNTLEYFGDVLIFWFPLYYELKILLLLYITLPSNDGFIYVYERFVLPYFNKHETSIDNNLIKLQKTFNNTWELYLTIFYDYFAKFREIIVNLSIQALRSNYPQLYNNDFRHSRLNETRNIFIPESYINDEQIELEYNSASTTVSNTPNHIKPSNYKVNRAHFFNKLNSPLNSSQSMPTTATSSSFFNRGKFDKASNYSNLDSQLNQNTIKEQHRVGTLGFLSNNKLNSKTNPMLRFGSTGKNLGLKESDLKHNEE